MKQLIFTLLILSLPAFAHESDDIVDVLGCQRASREQEEQVNAGNLKYQSFLEGCIKATKSSFWCNQVARPNPKSRNTFNCTYGATQLHRLINPDEATWNFAYEAIKMVKELQAKGIRVSQIYNWWRPEPYNANVGGSKTRHPHGTSVDVRFRTKADTLRAHRQLCIWRKQGRLKALGYYGGTGLHFGVGDAKANLWGRTCK